MKTLLTITKRTSLGLIGLGLAALLQAAALPYPSAREVDYTWQRGDSLSNVLFKLGIGHSSGSSRLYGRDGWVARNMSYYQRKNWDSLPNGTIVKLLVPALEAPAQAVAPAQAAAPAPTQAVAPKAAEPVAPQLAMPARPAPVKAPEPEVKAPIPAKAEAEPAPEPKPVVTENTPLENTLTVEAPESTPVPEEAVSEPSAAPTVEESPKPVRKAKAARKKLESRGLPNRLQMMTASLILAGGAIYSWLTWRKRQQGDWQQRRHHLVANSLLAWLSLNQKRPAEHVALAEALFAKQQDDASFMAYQVMGYLEKDLQVMEQFSRHLKRAEIALIVDPEELQREYCHKYFTVAPELFCRIVFSSTVPILQKSALQVLLQFERENPNLVAARLLAANLSLLCRSLPLLKQDPNLRASVEQMIQNHVPKAQSRIS